MDNMKQEYKISTIDPKKRIIIQKLFIRQFSLSLLILAFFLPILSSLLIEKLEEYSLWTFIQSPYYLYSVFGMFIIIIPVILFSMWTQKKDFLKTNQKSEIKFNDDVINWHSPKQLAITMQRDDVKYFHNTNFHLMLVGNHRGNNLSISKAHTHFSEIKAIVSNWAPLKNRKITVSNFFIISTIVSSVGMFFIQLRPYITIIYPITMLMYASYIIWNTMSSTYLDKKKKRPYFVFARSIMIFGLYLLIKDLI